MPPLFQIQRQIASCISSCPLPIAGEEGTHCNEQWGGEGVQNTGANSPHLSHRAGARRAPVLSRKRERTISSALLIRNASGVGARPFGGTDDRADIADLEQRDASP